MNIANALDAALPELPERLVKTTMPKLDPRVIAKEQLERGQPVVLAKLPGGENFIRFEPAQWVLLQLFDGKRSYGEISNEVISRTGAPYSENAVREFAAFIRGETDLFYTSPMEKNIALYQQLRGKRQKRNLLKIADFTDITIADWPNADAYVSKIYPWFRWVYTWWFTLLALGMFVLMGIMWAERFGEIWRDSFEFYNFTAKSGGELLEFWFLFGVMAFFHESFHGLTCKHFGGDVEKMGFTLMYFAPSFLCDITQVWIYGGKWQRIATAAAGIWGDLILCFIATCVWWGTAPGMFTHNMAYKIMMVTGVGVSLLNLNPLIKLDGYFIFSELIGDSDFHERTSAYLSGWVRKNIFRMPAELEYVRHWQRPLFLLYASLSGLYGYLLLSFLMVFSYNVLHRYSPAWAFVPACLAGYWVFRKRIHSLGRFSKLFYLDKKERLWSGLTLGRIIGLGATLLLFLFIPIWPDFQNAAFTLEPIRQASIHAAVKGRVMRVFVDDGEKVTAGQPLITLENLDLQSQLAKAQADSHETAGRATQSRMRYNQYGVAELERRYQAQVQNFLTEESTRLEIASPISGVVATAHVQDLKDADLDEGTVLMDIVDYSALVARVYLPEFSMHDVRVGSMVRLRVPSRLVPISGTVGSISADCVPLDPSLGQKEQLTGIHAPRFFAAEVWLPSTEALRPGMTGIAKVLTGRRSLAKLSWRFARDSIARRVW